jgi:GntR family transcriptional regulator / MocR family aminotransferase
LGWTIDRERVFASASGAPAYEQIATAIDEAIARGELQPGEQLPTIRALARQLKVSSASVAVAYSVLERRGRVDAHVGRGTFVSPIVTQHEPRGLSGVHAQKPAELGSRPSATGSWRRRVLYFGDRLRAVNPDALVCTSSWPDPGLLPVQIIKLAYAHVLKRIGAADLQYSGPWAHPELASALLPTLERDGVEAETKDLLVVHSVAQLIGLALQVAPSIVGGDETVVAVEEPGYHAAFNLVESRGHRMLGLECDSHGVLPASLEQALAHGANVVLLTPRALNPTGASWTAERRLAVAGVLAGHPGVLVIEDDHFAGLAASAPGSLGGDPRLAERTVYVRSFSKSIAPDLRITVAIARGRLHALLRDVTLGSGGWAPHLNQRVLAAALANSKLDAAAVAAREAYAARRHAIADAVSVRLPSAHVAPAADGLNVWVTLPPACDALEVVQHAAQLGVLVSSGEAFHLRQGHRSAVRLSVGRVDTESARRAGELLARAVLTVDDVSLPLVV